MKTEKVKLSQIEVNRANPRSITDKRFAKLINSLLELPQMLEIRPIVVDDSGVVLGGNMRFRALTAIKGMSEQEVVERITKSRNIKKKPKKEQDKIINYWKGFLEEQSVTVVKASNLTDAEKKEFIIKDNGDFGQWDYDMLADCWDADDLCDWGVDVWKTKEVENVFGGTPTIPTESGNVTTIENGSTQFDGTGEINENDLPPELQGIDLNPNNLPKIEGSDEVANERIIIVFPKERMQELANMLGMPSIDKAVYRLDEIIPA